MVAANWWAAKGPSGGFTQEDIRGGFHVRFNWKAEGPYGPAGHPLDTLAGLSFLFALKGDPLNAVGGAGTDGTGYGLLGLNSYWGVGTCR